MLREVADSCPDAREVLVFGGLPCVDLSILNAKGQGQDGQEASKVNGLVRFVEKVKAIKRLPVRRLVGHVDALGQKDFITLNDPGCEALLGVCARHHACACMCAPSGRS